MNPVEWILYAAACEHLLEERHPRECQCRLCLAASTVAALGTYRRGLLKLPTPTKS